MRTPILTLAALTACALSSGCIATAVAGAAGVGLFAAQDRTIGEGIDDATASQEVKTRLMSVDRAGFQEVDVEVANGNLLLSGAAPSERHRQTAENIARNVRSVHNVYNEITIGPRSSVLRGASDDLITGQIRARLAASSSVRGINVNIETFQGNVYLMGLARTQAELERAAEIASVVPGVVRVVSFMQVRPHDQTDYSLEPPTPVYESNAAGSATGYGYVSAPAPQNTASSDEAGYGYGGAPLAQNTAPPRY